MPNIHKFETLALAQWARDHPDDIPETGLLLSWKWYPYKVKNRCQYYAKYLFAERNDAGEVIGGSIKRYIKRTEPNDQQDKEFDTTMIEAYLPAIRTKFKRDRLLHMLAQLAE